MRIDDVRTDEERLECFEVLLALRPTLARETFLEDLARLGGQGYQLAAIWDPEVRCVAGYRAVETFGTGPVLVVDDLVTAEANRSQGYGERLIAFLEGRARQLGCRSVELDVAKEHLAAHRFCRAQGLTEIALHFSKATPAEARAPDQTLIGLEG